MIMEMLSLRRSEGFDDASIQFNTYRDNTFICQSNCDSVLFHSIRWLKDGIDEASIQFNTYRDINGFDDASIQYNTYRDNTIIWHSNCNSVLFHSIRWLKDGIDEASIQFNTYRDING
ncbi:uncharacterized protein isoform X2 [Rhodnius prolixus]|uniref:uncharacterized protein isoform X2 n=1 Tax=Rhodnius prolixus TaxID=13249 RepID=UPI003D1885E5